MLRNIILLLSLFWIFSSSIYARITLPPILGDNMLLQQNSDVKLWGKSDKSKVTVTTSWDGKT